MSKKRTSVRSTGPVKGISASSSPGKNIKPAWTGMLEQDKPPASNIHPMKSAALYDEDTESEEDEGDGLAYGNRHSMGSRGAPLRPHSTKNRQTGFSLRDSMNALNVSRTSNTNVNDFFEQDSNDMLNTRQRSPFKEQELHRPSRRKKRINIGPFEPNITPDFEKAVVSGEYMDFSEMAVLLGYRKTPEEAFALLSKDILVWLDCFTFYTSILGVVSPGQISSLMSYSRTIMWIFKESQDVTAWWRYDKAYRRMAAIKEKTDWSIIDEHMLRASNNASLRDSLSCQECLTQEHSPSKCPYVQPLFKSNGSTGDNVCAPRRVEQIEHALANPEKSVKKPSEGLQLKFAFGYHGYNACNNVFYTQSNEMVFHTAAIGVVYNPRSHEQRFYLGHDDDVLCLTVHDEEDFVATGQIGRSPCTHVWDIVTLKCVAVLKGFHRRGIICVDFSGDGEKLADVGLDDDHCICIWNWRKEEQLANTRGHKDVIYNLEWNPYDVNKLVSVGVKHIKFWTLNERKIEKRTTTFGKAGELTDMLCICHSPHEDVCFTGAQSGEIYVWQDSTYRKAIPAHKGAVYAMFALLQSEEKGFVTGGADGVVMVWDVSFSQPMRAFKVEASRFPAGTILLKDAPPIRSIHTDEGNILIGTGEDDVIQIRSNGTMEMIIQGHGEGELWGLAVHPSAMECATVSDDRTLRIWDLIEHRLRKVAVLKKGGRCVAYSPDGKTIAVGLNDGSFMIMEAKSLKTTVSTKDRTEEIADIKFSPDGTYLGVASHDNFLDVYNVKRGKKRAVCRGNSSYLTHFDWDTKGRLIQTNSGAREHLLFEIPAGTRKTMGKNAVIKTDWSTFTSVIGPTVQGIYPPASDVTDVNASCRTTDYKLLATGDDFGQVKVFRYPVLLRGAKFRSYKGHCSHVTNVRWSHDDKFLVTVGGMDATLLLWERVPAGQDFQEDEPDSGKLVQPTFKPSGTIKDPFSKGKPIWD